MSSQQSPGLLPVIRNRQQTPTPKQQQQQLLPVEPSPGGSSLDAESDSGTDQSTSSEEEEEEEQEQAGVEAARRVRQTTGEEEEALFERVGTSSDIEEEYEEAEEGYQAYAIQGDDQGGYYDEEEEVLMEDEDEEGLDDVALAARIISGVQQPGRDVWEETRSYGGGSGAGGGSGGAGGWSAFENVGTKALGRRAGTGNGGKKGKGWRAAELPVEIIVRILAIVGDRLVSETFAKTPRHIGRKSLLGHNHRWTLAYLQARSCLVGFRLVGRSWREAVEGLPFWDTLVSIVFGPPTPPQRNYGTVTLSKASSWLQSHCLVCTVSGYPPRKIAYPAIPSQYGRIAVCVTHSDSSCSRCLFGPSSTRSPNDFDAHKAVRPISMGDEEWFGEEEVASCRDCRLEALQFVLVQRGGRPINMDDEMDAGSEAIYDYVVAGDGDAGSAAVEILERRWLVKNTKFADLQNHAMISRQLGQPEKKSEEERKIRRRYHGFDEDDDMEGNFDEDDDFDDEDEDSEEDDWSLAKSDTIQVAEMALKDWMNQRVVEGFWISPSEQKYLAATNGNRTRDGRKSSSSGSIPAFKVAQPLSPFAVATPSNELHVPTVFTQSLPPDGGTLTQGADFVYGSSLREVIAPALEQMVRLASFTRDPIKIASTWSTDAILGYLRMPGAWIPGGLDYLAPDLIEMERRVSLSSRSSMSSSSGQGATPPSLLLQRGGAAPPPSVPSSQQQPSQPSRFPPRFVDENGDALPPPPPPPSVPSHEIQRGQSPFIGPQPPADLAVDGDVPSPMHSISSSHSHSPSPSTTNPSVSTPPSSTSPPTPSLLHPPPSPRKPSVGLPADPPLPRSTTGTKTIPGVAPSSLPIQRAAPPPPPPPPAQISRPIYPIPCIPSADFVCQAQTKQTIDVAWFDAWEPLRRCLCGICLRGMGYPNGPANGASSNVGGERNGNGKRKETSGGGEDRERGGGGGGEKGGETLLPALEPALRELLKSQPPGRLEEMGFMLTEDGTPMRIVEEGTLGVETTTTRNASSDDDGSVKRARTDTV